MSQRSDISASIQTNFPNNQTNFITPTLLRGEQGLFEQYSVLNEQTASIIAEAVASSSAGTGFVTQSQFNAYTASTNTFTGSIQTQVNTLQSATSSYVKNSQTQSFASSGSNTWLDPQYFNPSGSYPGLMIDGFNGLSHYTGWTDLRYNSQINLVSSSVIEFQEGEYVGQNGMYFRRNTFLIMSSGSEVYAQTGSTSTTGSNGQVLGKANGLISWVNQSTGSGTIDTGSFATTGSNTFRGTETISGSIHLNTITGSGSTNGPIFTNFTQSGVVSGFREGGNLFMFRNSLSSGSVIITGSSNIGLVLEIPNASAATILGGGRIDQSAGTFDIQYPSGGLPPSLLNVNQQGGIRIQLPTASVHSASFSNSYITNTVTISGSNNSPITISNSTLGSVVIKADSSGSNSTLSINNSLIVGGSGNAPGIFMSQSAFGTSRFINASMMVGSFHTASLDAVTGSGGGINNIGLVGCGLFVSGTAASTVTQTSAGMFVGQFNEITSFVAGGTTRSLADPNIVKFAVGAGTNASSRLTALWVSSSGQTFSRRGIFASGSGTNPAFVYTGSVQGTGSIDVLGGSLTLQSGSLSIISGSLTIGNSAVNTNRIFQRGGNAQIASEGGGGSTYEVLASQSVVMASSQSQALAGGFNGSIIASKNSSLREAINRVAIIAADSIETSATTASFNSAVIGGNNNTLVQVSGSVILAGNNTTIAQGSYVVALGRDTAYSVSGSYTLYTQNINASGSLSATGDIKFASGTDKTTGTFNLNAGNPGTATIANNLVTATSLIFLTKQTNTNSGNGTVSVTSKAAGTFSVTSDHNGDGDTVAYLIVNPA